MISLKTHGVFDYTIGVALIVIPYIFGFSTIEAARNTYLVLGIGLIAYSLCTRYPYSAVKAIPVGVHMGLDVMAGLVLMVAPWIFNYVGQLTTGLLAVHFVMGLGAIALVAVTQLDTIDRSGAEIEDEEEEEEIEAKRVA